MECEKAVDVKKNKSCEANITSDLRKEVENHYKLSLPEDFYHFWKFCEELDPEKPAAEIFIWTSKITHWTVCLLWHVHLPGSGLDLSTLRKNLGAVIPFPQAWDLD